MAKIDDICKERIAKREGLNIDDLINRVQVRRLNLTPSGLIICRYKIDGEDKTIRIKHCLPVQVNDEINAYCEEKKLEKTHMDKLARLFPGTQP